MCFLLNFFQSLGHFKVSTNATGPLSLLCPCNHAACEIELFASQQCIPTQQAHQHRGSNGRLTILLPPQIFFVSVYGSHTLDDHVEFAKSPNSERLFYHGKKVFNFASFSVFKVDRLSPPLSKFSCEQQLEKFSEDKAIGLRGWNDRMTGSSISLPQLLVIIFGIVGLILIITIAVVAYRLHL